jgi:hypothetical protein
MRAKLKTDVTVDFRGYPVSAKAGTPLIQTKDGSGKVVFAIPPSLCDAGPMGFAGTWSIFGHDSKHFYVFVNDEHVACL